MRHAFWRSTNVWLLSGSISEIDGALAAKAAVPVVKVRVLDAHTGIRGINRLKDMVLVDGVIRSDGSKWSRQ